MNEPSMLTDNLANVIGWSNWLRAFIYIAVGYVSGKYISKAIEKILSPHMGMHHKTLIVRIVFYTLLILFSVSALREFGFKLSVLLGAAGLLTVALGFASQTSASNFISGLFLLGERPFSIGDIILVDNVRGEIITIDLLSIKLRTFDNLFVRIPNETIIKSTVTNLSRFPIRRADIKVGIAYGESTQKARKILLELAEKNPLCLNNPAPFCIVTDFGASSVDLQLSVWTDRLKFLQFKNDIMENIKDAFDSNGIEIPFPHTSLYAGSKSAPIQIQLVEAVETENPFMQDKVKENQANK
ncbi:mechanosensitive ion channel family protein [Marinicellulosiphila megalodicopiae]|uniref:mechanosensitive ion channel family protein n=1 Tax=Marinicellulosiphila megalodicopiae TaxID=2724896 RepID=UPI003BB1196F